ncbi:MAG: methyltransferase domain-containing protein [Ignavibacteria bacterium]|nr:methyltransferase domain-containing protein [Ignavibacteria bacterium]
MQYDPVKDKLGNFVKKSTVLRKFFYFFLGVIFLRERYVKRKISELFSHENPVKILDAGSGFGQYSYYMANKFPDAEILAVDVKTDYLEDCKYFFKECGINNTKFEFADLTEINFENEFDLILSVDVMEHIEDDIGVFKNFFRALKKGGRVIINTPSNLGGSDTETEGDESFIGEHVRNGYSEKEICDKLRSAGFEIESFEYTYGKWGRLYWKTGIKYPMLLLNKSFLFVVLLPLYYLLTLLPVLMFMQLDLNEKNKSEGTGILLTAKKAS